ncbi:MAG: hypothetical protein ACOYNQ_05275 [Burkholderiales bacterium]
MSTGTAVSVNPLVTDVNDAPTLSLTSTATPAFTEDSGVSTSDVVATFTTADAEINPVTVTLSDTTNYALGTGADAGKVFLTAAGVALVNNGQDLPAFTLTPNDFLSTGTAVSVDPSVTAVNDAPTATITSFDATSFSVFVVDDDSPEVRLTNGFPDNTQTLLSSGEDQTIFAPDDLSGVVTYDPQVADGTAPPVDVTFQGNNARIVFGTPFDDQLLASSGPSRSSIVYGFDGDDTLLGGAGNDGLIGGSGNDSIISGAGNDTIYAGLGEDYVLLQEGSNSVLDAGEGEDFIVAVSNGENIIDVTGGDRVVLVASDDSNTTIDVQLDSDESSDLSSDIYVFASDDTTVEVNGDDSADSVFVSAHDSAQVSVFGNAGDDFITADGGGPFGDGSSVGVYLDGGADSDYIVGGAGSDTVLGGSGDDSIYLEEGTNLVLDAGSDGGDDSIYANSDSVNTIAVVSDGFVFLEASDGSVTTITVSDDPFDADIRVAAYDDAVVSVFGASGNDFIEVDSASSDSAVTVLGGSGNDTIDASGSASDTTLFLDGEQGDDLLRIGGEDDLRNDGLSVDGGLGNDTLELTSDLGETISDSDFADVRSIENLVLGEGNDIVTLGSAAESAGIDSVFGGDGDDLIIVNDGYSTGSIDGGNGQDTLVVDSSDGFAGLLDLVILSSDDAVIGSFSGFGEDLLDGFTSDILFDNIVSIESLVLGSGDDVFLLGAGADYAGINSLDGGEGNDLLGFVDPIAEVLDVSLDSELGPDAGIDVATYGTDGVYLDGGVGEDTFLIPSVDRLAQSTIDGGNGSDTILFAGLDIDVSVSDGAISDVSLSITSFSLSDGAFSNVSSVEVLEFIGSDRSGSDLTDLLGPFSGIFSGFGTGEDQGGDDFITLGSAAASAGIESVYAGVGNDTIDVLDEFALGTTGVLYLDGGFGDDTFVLERNGSGGPLGDPGLTIAGDDGTDTIEISVVNIALEISDAAFTNVHSVEILDTTASGFPFGSSDSITLGSEAVSAGIESVFSGFGSDIIVVGSDASDAAFYIDADFDDDTVTAGDGDDTILGGFGEDTITLGAGTNSVLDAGLGDDAINANSSDSTNFVTVTGSGLVDLTAVDGSVTTIDVGSDDVNADIYVDAASDATVSVLGVGGNDTIDVSESASGATLYLDGGSGEDLFRLDDLAQLDDASLTIEGGFGNDTVEFTSSVDQVFSDADFALLDGHSIEGLIFGSGEDTITLGSGAGSAGILSVDGGAGDDLFLVDSDGVLLAFEDIDGGSGNDAIEITSSANQSISDASFADVHSVETLVLGSGNDTVILGSAAEAAGITSVFGADGNDYVDASGYETSAVYLDGGSGNDTLVGGDGNDTIVGGAGARDSLVGGDGEERFVYTVSEFVSTETVDGGTDTDTLVFTNAGAIDANGFVNKSRIERIELSGLGNTLTLGFAATNALEDLTVIGGAGNDIVNGLDFGESFTVDGGAGNDSVVGSSTDDSLVGGEGEDTISGRNGSDTIDGGAGNDVLEGGLDDDVFTGGAGNDVIDLGGGVNSVLDAGDGDDSIVAAAGSTNTVTVTGSDTVTINAAALSVTTVSVTGGVAADIVVIGASGSTVSVLGADENDSIDVSQSASDAVLYLDGGDGNDTFTVSYGGAIITIVGGLGDDVLAYAGSEDITISDGDFGSGGFDFAAASIEILQLGSGNDLVTVGSDAEAAGLLGVFGGGGNDTIDAADYVGTITLDGGAGNDTLIGGASDDLIITGGGNDSLTGGDGSDTFQITVDFGNDTVNGVTISNFATSDDVLRIDDAAIKALLGDDGEFGFRTDTADAYSLALPPGTGRFPAGYGGLVVAADEVAAVSAIFDRASNNNFSYRFLFLDTAGTDAGLHVLSGTRRFTTTTALISSTTTIIVTSTSTTNNLKLVGGNFAIADIVIY